MYTLNPQPIFNPMQTSIFKQAHTGTCINNYDLNSIVALSNLFQASNGSKMKEQTKDDCHSNIVTSSEGLLGSIRNGLQSSLDNQANVLDNLNATTKSDNNQIYNNLKISIFQQQLNQLQTMPTALFNLSNPAFDLASALQLVNELNKTNQVNNQQTRPNKRQKVIPNPLQLAYSNLNPTNQLQNEQVQPLDLSIKSASSTNSNDHFILEPMNLLNRPDNDLDKTIVNDKIQNSIIDNSNLVQIQNALCKKKKIMAQQAAEILKKSSFSSAPNSPSSIATSSSPFDLDNSHSNQSNLSNLLPINEADSVQAYLNSKKRKFSESSLSLELSSNSQVYLPNSTAAQTTDKPKLKAKRKTTKRKASINSLESLELPTNSTNVQQVNQDQLKPSTIIIDAENTFPCPICGEIFAFKDRLSKHIKSKHRNDNNSNTNGLSTSQQPNGRNSPNQRSYVCNSPNQRSYSCNDCGREFARSDMLTRHSRRHTGLKPYSCDICKNTFTRSDHLATHRRTHSGEKPYKCSGCDYKACRRDMITRHMKKHLTENGGKAKASTVVLLAVTKNNKTNKTSANDLVQQTDSNTANGNNEESNLNVTSTVASTDSSTKNEK